MSSPTTIERRPVRRSPEFSDIADAVQAYLKKHGDDGMTIERAVQVAREIWWKAKGAAS